MIIHFGGASVHAYEFVSVVPVFMHRIRFCGASVHTCIRFVSMVPVFMHKNSFLWCQYSCIGIRFGGASVHAY